MKYNKEEAFKRLKIPEELQRRVFVFNIPKWLCRFARWTGLTEKCSAGMYFYFDSVIILASDKIEETDYTLAHEILGHKKKHNKLKLAYEEAHAVEQGLMAIKSIHSVFYHKSIKKIKDYQEKGPKGLCQRLLGKTYYKNVNLKKLKGA